MFLTLEEVKSLISTNKILHIAGDESLLSQLPKGNWIGGTTPYFITNEGGVCTKEKLFVNDLTSCANHKVKVYGEDVTESVVADSYDNGYAVLILPFSSPAAMSYAKKAPYSSDLLVKPVVGWISGFDLATDGCAKVYDGTTGEVYTDKCVALHIELPEHKIPAINIVNIFTADESGDVITFDEDAFEVGECFVNGVRTNFAKYIESSNVDTKLPLVADNNGIYINVSIKEVDDAAQIVKFYAPVLKGNEYRFAKLNGDYAEAFAKSIAEVGADQVAFSCNCILNYLYGNLEGKATPPFEGPVTFGEVAYQLLNQTLVYIEY